MINWQFTIKKTFKKLVTKANYRGLKKSSNRIKVETSKYKVILVIKKLAAYYIYKLLYCTLLCLC